jgi:hypothetical protein
MTTIFALPFIAITISTQGNEKASTSKELVEA